MVYDALTDEVMRTTHAFLPGHLTNWFLTIDETPSVAGIVARLQSGLDLNSWLTECLDSNGGMGSTRLFLPKEREKRLGMQLLLFRAIADGKQDAAFSGTPTSTAATA